MNLKHISKKIFLLATAIALSSGLIACTTINPYTGESQVSDTTIGAGLGAASGALIGGMINGGKGALVGAAAGGLVGAGIGHAMDNENAELRQRLVGTGVQVSKVGNGIQLSMSSDVTFKTDSADINSYFYSTLDSVAIVLKKYNRTNIMVSGYTDSTGSDQHNQILSENRARSVGDYLISQGINQSRVFTEGFGKRNPVATNSTVEGRAQNRRVVITLRPLA